MDNFEYLINELRKMGLDKKESLIYMTLLKLGPATAQELSQKIKISRPTVYRILENLQKKDLVFREKKSGKKKSFFAASSPDHFLNILHIKKRKVEEQEREFLRIISVLQTKFHLISDKNEIRTYSKKIALDDLANSNNNKLLIIFGSKCFATNNDLKKIYSKIRNRVGKQLLIKEIHQKETIKKNLAEFLQQKTIKSIPKQLGTSSLVISDKVFLFGDSSTFCIEHEETKNLLVVLFETIWNSN